jgi:uncharacterized cupredoxin-like copper-binding protein
MTLTRRMSIAAIGGIFAALCGSSAIAADSTIAVSLWDKGPDSAVMDNSLQFPLSQALVSDMAKGMEKAMMGIKIDQATVPAGKVTFNVSNDSKDIIHEMIVSPITSLDEKLPYLADQYKIDEDAAGHLGEVAELEPGKSGMLAIDLKPGMYLLYCNIPGHYIGGMWNVLTVTP